MKTESTGRSIALAFLYFLFSAILTGWFIAKKSWLYDTVELMFLSGCIAGSKWVIQLLAALILLRDKRWLFIKSIAFVCLIGSAALLVYYFFPVSWGFSTLTISVGCSVLVMLFLYYRAVKKMALHNLWFWGWVVCLLTALYLQLTIVFDVI